MRVEESVTITPAMAREWLKMNDANRPTRQSRVDQYAADMLSGDWQDNGQTIGINGKRLINGQHRLLACVQADVPFVSAVAYDVPAEMVVSMDQGASRTLSDVLRWKGHTNYVNALASGVRLIWRWESGILLSNRNPTIAQSLAWLSENERFPAAVALGYRLTAAPLRMRSAVTGPVYYRAMLYDEEAASEFFDRLLDGEHLTNGMPVYALRRLLMTNATRVHGRMGANPMLAVTIKAWNAWIQNEPMEVATVRRTEKFPVMVSAEGAPIAGPEFFEK